jgi:uncharacterized repeat protein (TIGR01451 family)
MKQKLLFLIFLISFSIPAFSQAVAYPVANLTTCAGQSIDLSVQTPIALGNQNPQTFSVSYFETQAAATAAANPITNLVAYFAAANQILFIRVTNNTDSTYAITTFNIIVNPILQVMPTPNVTACESYTLPPIQVGNYFTDPGGTGAPLFPGLTLTNSQTVYVFAQAGSCTTETSFQVTIIATPSIWVGDINSCDPYTLSALPVGQYFTNANGTGQQVPAGTVISETSTLYVFAESNTVPNCIYDQSFTIHIGNPIANQPTPLIGCDQNGNGFASFDLYTKVNEITGGAAGLTVTFHETEADAIEGLMAFVSVYGNISPNPILYVRVENTQGGCFTIVPLQLISEPCANAVVGGTVRIDSDNNGCTANDPPAVNQQVLLVLGSQWNYTYTDAVGHYEFSTSQFGFAQVYLQSGINGTVAPTSYSLNVISGGTSTVDFCIHPNLISNDAAVYFYATSGARPGFPATYQLIVHNNGNNAITGSATLNFDISKLDFVSATPSQSALNSNSLTFDFSNVLPTQNEVYFLQFTVKTPPTVQAGHILAFDAAVAIDPDSNSNNNVAFLNQTVVNSYDPNDISVAQGESILQNQVGDDLVYTIRFQNTGTADAINVRLENTIDAKLDASTFRPVTGSHPYTVERIGSNVKFRFTGINLPASSVDEPASHGFVTYRVKPVSDLAVGDVIPNTADIYFDFNAAITTNTVTTQLVSLMGVGENSFESLAVYPNPASGYVTVQFNDEVSENAVISILDIQGKVILSQTASFDASQVAVDISKLQSGLYFVKVVSDGKSATKKLLVN